MPSGGHGKDVAETVSQGLAQNGTVGIAEVSDAHLKNEKCMSIYFFLSQNRFSTDGGRRAGVRKQDSYTRAIETGCPPAAAANNNFQTERGMGRCVS